MDASDDDEGSAARDELPTDGGANGAKHNDNDAVVPSAAVVVSPAVAKKRLLPMELRRRRRAAKLQPQPEKVGVEEKEASLKQAVDEGIPASSETQSACVSEVAGDNGVHAVRHATIKSSPAADDIAEDPALKATAPLERLVSAPTPSTAAARLSSFYNWSAIDRKRQRVQNRMHVDVPSKFHAEQLPIDMAPKAKAIILTSFPLPFLRPSRHLTILQSTHSLLRCSSSIRRRSVTSCFGAPSMRRKDPANELRWHQALRYFTHPATPLPASITLNRMAVATTKTDTSMMSGGKSEDLKDELEFYSSRLLQWQDAFRDVYFGFRGMRDDRSFYVRSKEFTVCFFYEGRKAKASVKKGSDDKRSVMSGKEADDPHLLEVCRRLLEETANQSQEEANADGSDAVVKKDPPEHEAPKKRQLCAVMSQSSARIRKTLHRLNIEHTIPYGSANATQREIGQFHLLEAELVAMESHAQSASTQQNVRGPDSLLHFSGHHAVHGLYEFLINRKPLTKQDVPEIHALYPFANAAIKSLEVKYMGQVAASVSTGGEESATMFRTEVSGFCFPSCLNEILQILKDEHEKHRQDVPMPRHRSQSARQQLGGDEEVATAATSQSGAVVVRAYMETVSGAERLNSLHLTDDMIRKKAASGSSTLEMRERWKQELDLSKRRIESVVIRQQSQDEEVALFEVETTTRTQG
ncbi:hypothetical protein FI667_g7952, partial [Globisporangium splendens]